MVQTMCTLKLVRRSDKRSRSRFLWPGLFLLLGCGPSQDQQSMVQKAQARSGECKKLGDKSLKRSGKHRPEFGDPAPPIAEWIRSLPTE